MSDFVLDASVVVKCFVPEIHSVEARRWQSVAATLHAPTFFDVEVANIVWKKVRRAEITRSQADAILSQVLALPITRHPDGTLVAAAFDIADQTVRTVYDSLYVALAVSLGGRGRDGRSAAIQCTVINVVGLTCSVGRRRALTALDPTAHPRSAAASSSSTICST